MTLSEQKSFYREQLESVKSDYVKDLEAMTEEQLASSSGGKARSAYDMTYEVAHVNSRIAVRLRGGVPEPWKFEGWMHAPDELRTKAAAVAHFTQTFDEVISAWESIPDAEVGKVIETPNGPTNPCKLAFFAVYHTGYHDAQLNYIQSIGGDDTIHWG